MSVIEHWWPVTYEYGLLRSDAKIAATEWHNALAADRSDIALTHMSGPLETCLKTLEPLSPAPTQSLFLQTKTDWCVFLRNSTRGSDAFMPMWHLSRRLDVLSMRVCTTPPGATWPAVIWEVFDTPANGGADDHRKRSVAAANDGGRWSFHQSGAPFHFEDLSQYKAKRVRDRFPVSLLLSYLSKLGAPALSDTIFPSAVHAIGVGYPPHLDVLSLEDARKRIS